MKKKILALLCAGLMLLSGCGKDTTTSTVKDFDFKGYPIENAPEMTMWVQMNKNMSLVVDNLGKTPMAEELQKRTGVKVNYEHPVMGQESTAIGLLLTSDKLPDMIQYSWKDYNGGAKKQIEEGTIIALNDYMEKYAPNLTNYLKENPEIDKMVKTEDGTYFAFPVIRSDKRLLISKGCVVRRDWLDKYNLEMPETADDIENILRTFKQNGVEKPLSMPGYELMVFVGNFNAGESFHYNDKKDVVYGPMTDDYKNAIVRLNKWYDEGLLDKNYISVDSKTLKADVLNDKVGMTVCAGGNDLGTWVDTKNAKGEAFDMVGFPFTSPQAGQKHTINRQEWNVPGYSQIAITTDCENPAMAVAYLDYSFGAEGRTFFNYGTEGVSYEVKDGKNVFTDLINNNPDGLTRASAMTMHIPQMTLGGFIQEKDYIDQFYQTDLQRETLDAWTTHFDNAQEYMIPPYTLTEAEMEEYTSIMTEINSFIEVERDKFITGQRPLDEWDDYVNELKAMNIERAIEIVKTACDRYDKI